MFSNTLNLCSFLNVKIKFHTHTKLTGKSTVQYN
jgi:hypothetical protein